MSLDIWTRCGAKSNVGELTLRAFRVVEAQHLRSTRKIVDSDEEQQILEQTLDELKPRVPARARGLHFLLFTPFRYPPLVRGSRFGSRTERSIWYGSEIPETAFCEVAYYRFLFLDGTRADLGRLRIELTSFQVKAKSHRAVDLTRLPFKKYERRISSKTAYADAQKLGARMRQAGIEIFRYTSARDPKSRPSVALLEPVFTSKVPTSLSTWHCFASHDVAEFTEKNYFEKISYRFARRDFEVRGKLPAPAA